MTHKIVHSKVSTIPDSPDASLVKPSDWNSQHSIDWGWATPNESIITAADADVAGDPNFDKIAALLHMNGVNLSTTFTDQTAKVWTSSGGARLSSDQSKFGGVSAYFNGTSAFITTPDHASFELTTTHTIEFFARFDSLPAPGASCVFVSKWEESTNKRVWMIALHNVSGTQYFRVYNSDLGSNEHYVEWAVTPVVNAWYHFCVTREANSVRLYIDGSQVGSTQTIAAASLFDTDSSVAIGAQNPAAGGANFFNGYIDELRITQGVRRYTANFTVQTVPFYDSFPGVNMVAGRNYQSAGPITIEETDVNVPDGTNWVIT